MEEAGAWDADSDEPTAFGHQQTEELPSSAALREKSASEPDERADHPSVRDPGHGCRKGPGDLRGVDYNIVKTSHYQNSCWTAIIINIGNIC